jgi:hypothetical protein
MDFEDLAKSAVANLFAGPQGYAPKKVSKPKKATEPVAEESEVTDYGLLAAGVISNMFGDDDKITPSTLTRSSVPPKREGKRHNDRVKERGSNLPKDFMQAAYTDAFLAEVQTARLPRHTGPDWNGIVENRHTPNKGCGRVV